MIIKAVTVKAMTIMAATVKAVTVKAATVKAATVKAATVKAATASEGPTIRALHAHPGAALWASADRLGQLPTLQRVSCSPRAQSVESFPGRH